MAMVLREAFRYQNFIESILGAAERFLAQNDNIMKVVENHNCSKAQPSVEDFIKEHERTIDVSPDTVIDFYISVFKEREALSRAINDAKVQHCPDMDMELSLNKTRQRIAGRLKQVSSNKPTKSVTRGSAFCFNNEGNQVQFYYDINVESEPDFNRQNVKKIVKEITEESDTISTRLDYYLSNVPVNFEKSFDMNETFEELIEEYNKPIAS